ncbi:hypothetical protein Bbelb_157490 [Branchiostoma belcheri]|nr:hypothetical protein Bbelb_157490 [Branchiostoma belcheri]
MAAPRTQCVLTKVESSESEVNEDSSLEEDEDDGKISVKVKPCTYEFWTRTRKEVSARPRVGSAAGRRAIRLAGGPGPRAMRNTPCCVPDGSDAHPGWHPVLDGDPSGAAFVTHGRLKKPSLDGRGWSGWSKMAAWTPIPASGTTSGTGSRMCSGTGTGMGTRAGSGTGSGTGSGGFWDGFGWLLGRVRVASGTGSGAFWDGTDVLWDGRMASGTGLGGFWDGHGRFYGRVFRVFSYYI